MRRAEDALGVPRGRAGLRSGGRENAARRAWQLLVGAPVLAATRRENPGESVGTREAALEGDACERDSPKYGTYDGQCWISGIVSFRFEVFGDRLRCTLTDVREVLERKGGHVLLGVSSRATC